MEEADVAHLAGLFDGAGSVTVHIGKDESYPLDYRYQPAIRLYRAKTDEAMLGKLDAYCEDYGVQYHLNDKDETVMFEVSNLDSIQRFLEPILPWLVTHHQDARLMVEEILPAIEENRHKTKDGFYELAGYADTLRGGPGKGRKAKYTQKFFKEKWEIKEAPS